MTSITKLSEDIKYGCRCPIKIFYAYFYDSLRKTFRDLVNSAFVRFILSDPCWCEWWRFMLIYKIIALARSNYAFKMWDLSRLLLLGVSEWIFVSQRTHRTKVFAGIWKWDWAIYFKFNGTNKRNVPFSNIQRMKVSCPVRFRRQRWFGICIFPNT